MAKRMPVVLSESHVSNPARRKLEEDLVAVLLFEDGVEISVIPDLEHLDAQGTGLLCLEGMTSDLVLLSWLEAGRAVSILNEKGIEGRVGRTALDAPASAARNGRPASCGRVVHCLDLERNSDVQKIRREINRIMDEAQMDVTQISGIGAPDYVSGKPITQRPDPATDSTPIARIESTDERTAASADPIEEELDELLDEFDKTDL